MTGQNGDDAAQDVNSFQAVFNDPRSVAGLKQDKGAVQRARPHTHLKASSVKSMNYVATRDPALWAAIMLYQ